MLIKGLVCYLSTDSPLNCNHNCPLAVAQTHDALISHDAHAPMYHPHKPCHLQVPFSHALTYVHPPVLGSTTCVWPTERK